MRPLSFSLPLGFDLYEAQFRARTRFRLRLEEHHFAAVFRLLFYVCRIVLGRLREYEHVRRDELDEVVIRMIRMLQRDHVRMAHMREYEHPLVFGDDRAHRAFARTHFFITIDSDDENVAKRFCSLEILRVPDMKEIEGTGGKHGAKAELLPVPHHLAKPLKIGNIPMFEARAVSKNARVDRHMPNFRNSILKN